MKSNVYFSDLRTSSKQSIFAKMDILMEKVNINELIRNLGQKFEYKDLLEVRLWLMEFIEYDDIQEYSLDDEIASLETIIKIQIK